MIIETGYWFLIYWQNGTKKTYRFGAKNYFTANVKALAWMAFKGGITKYAVVPDIQIDFSEN